MILSNEGQPPLKSQTTTLATWPYLDTKNADVFESPTYLCGIYARLSNLIATTLLKIKLLLDLTELRNALRDYKDVPADVVKAIQDQIPRSPITARMSSEELAETLALEKRIEDLQAQVSIIPCFIVMPSPALPPLLRFAQS